MSKVPNMQGGMQSNKLRRDMKPRDAVISFQCSPPNVVQVIEMIDGERIHHQEVQRQTDAVTELEEKYIFFAKQADSARRQIRRGHSCVFNVYFREP
jgi:hypothetical protein